MISAFQAIPEFSKLLPTYLTLVASLLIIIISFVRVQSEVSVSHLRPSFFWCIVLSILITFGILDLWIDDGVEFIYFEFLKIASSNLFIQLPLDFNIRHWI